MPNALAVLAISERGGLLHAPDMYMDKIAVGPGLPEGIIDLDANERVPTWAEPDLNGSSPAEQPLLIRPMRAIPFGETKTYGEIAKETGLSAQAAGQCCRTTGG